MPAIRAEVDRLMLPRRVEATATDDAKRGELEARRARILDMFEAGHIDRDERERRLSAVYADVERLDAKRVILAVPRLDWTWPPRQINSVLRALFDGIDLVPDTFQPAPGGFRWRLPEEYVA